MKVEAEQAALSPGPITTYGQVTGQPLVLWALLALLNLATQAVLFHAMVGEGKPTGDFGTFNAALALVGLLAVPLAALVLVLRIPLPSSTSAGFAALRGAPGVASETAAWIWGAVCLALIIVPSPLLALPRFALQVLTVMNVLLALAALVSGALCAEADRSWRWPMLLVGGAVVRLAAAAWFTASQPWAEAALAAYLVAGFVTLVPVLRPGGPTLAERWTLLRNCADRDFRRTTLAVFSAMLGVYLFTNADRIGALSWLNVRIGATVVPSGPEQHIFDIYQATGLLARVLLWGTQPLLWLLYADRVRLTKTTAKSLRYFWIYLGALVLGAVLLSAFGRRGGLIDGLIPQAGDIAPTFAVVMVPLGLLQGLAAFALASDRRPECHVLGVSGVVYAVVLALVGRRPETMLPYMLGLSLIALMAVLFVGVVRWGRKQP